MNLKRPAKFIMVLRISCHRTTRAFDISIYVRVSQLKICQKYLKSIYAGNFTNSSINFDYEMLSSLPKK